MCEENSIKDRDSYLKLFLDKNKADAANITNSASIQSIALQNALDIRKFEIDLYWKRAAYFWAFIAASFAGYFAIVTQDSDRQNGKALLIVCILGFVFSYSWYFVNRGSKFWQNNWEGHVDYLEDEIMGPLYRLVRNPEACNFFNPISDYPISVSRINQMLSLLISLIWLYLVYDTIHITFNYLRAMEILFVELGGFIFVTFTFGYCCRSRIGNEQPKKTGKFIMRNFD